MFTGIIQEIGKVKDIKKTGKGICLFLDVKRLKTQSIRLGDSIAVNGVCLTVIEKNAKEIKFDVIPETLSMTNIGSVRKGDFVNLEQSLKNRDKLDGHIVQGHVDGIGIMKQIKIHESIEPKKASTKKLAKFIRFTISCNSNLMKYIAKKGSITLDGVSLTVSEVNDKNNSFCVELIPHTIKNTTLGLKKKNDALNIETDVLARYVERLIKR